MVQVSGTEWPHEQRNGGPGKVEIRFTAENPIPRMNRLQVRFRIADWRAKAADSRYPEIVAELSKDHGQQSIWMVDMRHVMVDKETVDSLTHLGQLQNLYVGYGFDDSMAELLSDFNHVKALDLSQSMVTDAGIKSLLKMPVLNRVVLGQNMTDKTMEVLAKSK